MTFSPNGAPCYPSTTKYSDLDFLGAEITVVGDHPLPRADLAWYVGEEWVRTGVRIEFSRACKSLLLYWVQTSYQQLCVECGLLETD